MPALFAWLVSHVFNHGSRSVCPLHGHHMCSRKDKENWEELLAGMTGASLVGSHDGKKGGGHEYCAYVKDF